MGSKTLDTSIKQGCNSEHNAGFKHQGSTFQFANYFKLHRVTFMMRFVKFEVTFKLLRRTFLLATSPERTCNVNMQNDYD